MPALTTTAAIATRPRAQRYDFWRFIRFNSDDNHVAGAKNAGLVGKGSLFWFEKLVMS